MRLDGPGGEFLELQIVGYQFPELAREPWDSNWLVVGGRVGHLGREWEFRDPCLLTYEASELCAWLEANGRGDLVNSETSFVEPNLTFCRVTTPAGPALRVALELEARPAWAKELDDLTLEFPLVGLDLVAAAAELRADLERFPQRATV